MYDVVALGELLIDFTTQSIDSDGYPTMAAHPGGAPANFLAAIAKFGGKVGMLGKVGTDTFGKLLTNTLRGAGIETKGLVAADAGQVLCLTDANGISGLLHYTPGRAQCEIRHLAVRADCRGLGCAGRLLRLLEMKTGGQKCIVWAPLNMYTKKISFSRTDGVPSCCGWDKGVLTL